ncbi:MAG: hypothetical protein EOO46_12130 [Flavobacterium sp.]|nr:MAG: hypothetical protein EOO46_12130 [Flavobacterium sp.]
MLLQMNSKGKQVKADPSRYDMRSELEDGSGFRVIGINHTFKYDEHGGWYISYFHYNIDLSLGTTNTATIITKKTSHQRLQQ